MFKRLLNVCIALVMPLSSAFLVVATAPDALASIFVTDLVDGVNPLPIPGNQDWPGQLGDDFTPTESLSISSIGVFDSDGNGTTGDLIWRLYEVATGALVHEEIVTASGVRPVGTTIEDNYIFKTLATNINLVAGTTYSAVAVGFDAIDKNFNTNFNLSDFDVVFSSTGLTSAGGRYSMTAAQGLPSVDAGNTASGNPYNFGAATFVYAAVPEATSVLVWSLITGLGMIVVRRR